MVGPKLEKRYSAPSVVSWGPNRIDVVALDRENQMHHKKFDGEWHDWNALGEEAFSSPPSIVSWEPNRLDIDGLDTDNHLLHKAWNGSKKVWEPSLTSWKDLGGLLSSPPSVVSWEPNRLDIFGLGEDNQMLHKAWNGSSWLPSVTGWTDLGGRFSHP
jgi:hypothetical protein